MVMALALSVALEAAGALGYPMEGHAARLLHSIDFDHTVLHGMLGFLLFAAALHIDLADLAQQRRAVLLLATMAVVISTFIVGTLLWLCLKLLGIPLPYIYSLLFGALVSPTDPVAGAAAAWMLARGESYQVAVLITLALVTGGFTLADQWHLSAPFSMVTAGLLLGTHGRLFAISEETRRHLGSFWELIDEILNAVLFVLIGLEVLVLVYTLEYFIVSLIAIPIVLLARFISVGLPIGLLRKVQSFKPGTVKILTWGGLRGGVSVALALSLPAGAARDLIVPVTYAVVAFSIIVQGLTIKKMIAKD